ncbi:hypothetical protein HanXRQr2_Chr09g0401821 [Helianthus annuus]|uniref:Uncharacterized protein n=1 Tax=Helianthus annuus TaxID=4232 RepID=A0A251TY63_HELAN|nr:uncharacterized protein LOC110876520 [Helianthus annuus]KAF5792063.1 hypothetical protein HanXRQr2_Chr09g0401821 [Helianthus annuus]
MKNRSPQNHNNEFEEVSSRKWEVINLSEQEEELVYRKRRRSRRRRRRRLGILTVMMTNRTYPNEFLEMLLTRKVEMEGR